MRFLVFLLLVLLVVKIGFWHALSAIFGAIAIVFLVFFAAAAFFIGAGVIAARRTIQVRHWR